MRRASSPTKDDLFKRSKSPGTFIQKNVPEEVIMKGSVAHHRVTALGKKKNGREYIAKFLSADKRSPFHLSLSALEVYSAWIFRLHILDGSRIPKHSLYPMDGVLISEKIPEIKDFFTILQESSSSEQEAGLLKAKILAAGKSNLRAFAQILVCSIVFAEDDLKEDHVVFNRSDELTRFDFGQCFTPKLDFNAADFKQLPLVSRFNPNNLIFNYSQGAASPERKKVGTLLRGFLGESFNQEVYAAILKILLMPDFLLEKIHTSIACNFPSFQTTLREHGYSGLAEQKKDALRNQMLSSPEFRIFLQTHGETAKTLILEELNQFRAHNSFFRKRWSESEFNEQCRACVDEAYVSLNTALGIDSRLSSGTGGSSVSITPTTPSPDCTSTPNESSGMQKRRALTAFLEGEIVRLKKCLFTRGTKDKIALLNAILQDVKNKSPGLTFNDPSFLREMHDRISMVAHHRRSRLSHLFTNGPSQSWVAWKTFCQKNNIEKPLERPTFRTSDKEIKTYNEYRKTFIAR